MEISWRIENKLNELGWSQSKLARESELSTEYINKIINEKSTNIGIEKVEKIAAALGMHPVELMYGINVLETGASKQEKAVYMATALSKTIKAIRKNLNLSVQEFSEKCRLSPSDITAIESCDSIYLRLDKQFKILRTLGIPHTWFDFATEPVAPAPVDKDQREILEDLKALSPSQKKLIKNMIHEMRGDSK